MVRKASDLPAISDKLRLELQQRYPELQEVDGDLYLNMPTLHAIRRKDPYAPIIEISSERNGGIGAKVPTFNNRRLNCQGDSQYDGMLKDELFKKLDDTYSVMLKIRDRYEHTDMAKDIRDLESVGFKRSDSGGDGILQTSDLQIRIKLGHTGAYNLYPYAAYIQAPGAKTHDYPHAKVYKYSLEELLDEVAGGS